MSTNHCRLGALFRWPPWGGALPRVLDLSFLRILRLKMGIYTPQSFVSVLRMFYSYSTPSIEFEF